VTAVPLVEHKPNCSRYSTTPSPEGNPSLFFLLAGFFETVSRNVLSFPFLWNWARKKNYAVGEIWEGFNFRGKVGGVEIFFMSGTRCFHPNNFS
jgi:hypothetical protein